MSSKKLMSGAIGCILLLTVTSSFADESSSEESPGYEFGFALGQAIGKELEASIRKETERCKNIPGEAEKTSCFNNALRVLGREPAADVHGLWVVGMLTDPITDQENGSATVQARPEKDSAKLTVRCLREKVDVFIQWPSTTKTPPAGEPVSVRTRINSGEREVTEWRMAEVSPNVTFYKGDVVEFANRLAKGEQVVIELASSEGTGVEVFDTREAGAAFAKLREPCNW